MLFELISVAAFGPLVEPMVWAYGSDLSGFFPLGMVLIFVSYLSPGNCLLEVEIFLIIMQVSVRISLRTISCMYVFISSFLAKSM